MSLRLPILLSLLSPFAAASVGSSAAAADGDAYRRILQNNDTTSSPPTITATPTASPAVAVPSTSFPTQTALEPWGGCVDPRDPGAKVLRGARTTICLTVGPGGSWNRVVPGAGGTGGVEYQRFSFQPIADEYSVYRVPESFVNFVDLGKFEYVLPNITIFVSSGTAISFLRRWYEKDGSDSKIFPHLTAIIDVKNGVVSGITFDDACVFCASSMCIPNTYDFDGKTGVERGLSDTQTKGCYLPQSVCLDHHKKGGNDCDLTLFVVWTGTDVDGNVMSSSNSRFSAFQAQQIQDRWGQRIGDSVSAVQGVGQSISDTVTGTIDGAIDGVNNAFGGGEEEGEN